MMAGRGSVKVCRSRSGAVVSTMPKKTWQVNYKRISKESCVSIPREVRGELPEPSKHFWDFLQLARWMATSLPETDSRKRKTRFLGEWSATLPEPLHLPRRFGSMPMRSDSSGRSSSRSSLKGIRAEDEVQLETKDGSTRYFVVWARIVVPEGISVLDSTSESALTLVTCSPFYFVGAAQKRFVVRSTQTTNSNG